MKAWMVTCFLPSVTGFGNFTVYTEFEEVRSKVHIRELEALCKKEMKTNDLCALFWQRLPDDDRECEDVDVLQARRKARDHFKNLTPVD